MTPTKINSGDTTLTPKNGAFACITARCKIFEHYEDVPQTLRDKTQTLVLMMNRWDGRVGFPGGMVDNGESLVGAAQRELMEETGFHVTINSLQPLVSHQISERMSVHAFHTNLGDVPQSYLREILRNSLNAKHAITEGTPFWVHLEDYGKGHGLRRLLDSNNLASGVKEELEWLCNALNITIPDPK